jgi:outer membrane receptor protein involved in Fe transport
MSKKFLALIAMVLCLLSGTIVFGQSTSGSISGTITDDSGAAIPGVTVELSGPAMQGVKSTVTDNTGKYRFLNVPPGEGYKVQATLSGFQDTSKTGFRVSLGQEGTVNLALRPATSESITVTAEAPLVDVTKTTTGVNVTAAQFESLPTTRSFQQLTTIAPGVNMEMGDSRNLLTNSPNVGASSAPENNYIIDGLSTTDARYGTSGTNLTMNFVEEVQVMTGGYSAEYGRSTGGVFNVITKSGGNEFHGDLFGYYRDADWSDASVRTRSKGDAQLANLSDNADLGLSLGGPIMRDKLWFFGAFDPTRRTTYIGELHKLDGSVNTNATDFDTNTDFYAAKLTWALTPNHSLIGTVFGDPTTREGWITGYGASAVPAAALRKADIGSNNMNLRYTGIFGPKFLVEASIGQHKKDNTMQAATDAGRTGFRQIDETDGGGFEYGGFNRLATDESNRDSYAVKLSNFFGGHELRYGIDTEKNNYDANTHETWYRFFGGTQTSRFRGECAGITCQQIQERIYSVAGNGTTDNQAAFLQDQWKVMPNLQLNLGIRYEVQKMSSARGVALARSGDDINTGDYLFQDGYDLDNNWAPRLGIVWDPMNNGRSKVYAFGGRFFEAIPLDLNIRALNGEDYIINDYQHVNTDPLALITSGANPIPVAVRSGAVGAVTEGGYTKYRSRNLTAANYTALAADLKAQYQDEFIVGGEYQFGSAWSAGARFVDRELKRVIEDFGTFTNPDDPSELTGYAIGNPGEGVLGGPYQKPDRYYRAIELTAQRARLNNWQLTTSFVYAQSKGNYEGLFMTGYEQLDPNITALYDIPSFLQNAEGKLRSDKPYNFKVHSSYTFPFGLTLGEGFYYSAGIPVSAQGPEIVNGYGDGTIFLKPRGSEGRTPDFWNLDLHADWALPWLRGGGRGLSAIIDVFNVTDQHEVLEVDQDYVYQALGDEAAYSHWFDESNLDSFGNPKFNSSLPASPYFNTPILYQSPRTVQLGLKFTY